MRAHSVQDLVEQCGITQDSIDKCKANMPNGQLIRVSAYRQGYGVSTTSQGERPITVFMFNSNHYTTNLKRSRMYSFDDAEWTFHRLPIWKKVWLITTGKTQRATPSKKAILAGVVNASRYVQ